LSAAADPYDPASVRAALAGAPLHASVEVHEEIGSTQDRAALLARAGAPEGTLVVAAAQTRGRGRRGRTFASPPGGVYLSLVLRPPEAALRGLPLTMPAALAAALALERATGQAVRCALKWPNDVLIGRRKAGGVLADVERDGAVVLGVGLDLNVPVEAFPEDLRAVATSCLAETGRRFERRTVLRAFLEALALRYRGDARALAAELAQRSAVLGRRVRLPDGSIARPLGLGDRGELRVERPDGRVEALLSGPIEIVW